MLNQNRQPLITVITSYYNDQDFLADAIQSVLSQTYQNFEYILVNHASEDRSRAIAHSFKDSRIKHVDLSINYGATGSFLVKAGLDCASPDSVYVKLLSADDVLLPRALESLLCVSLSPRRPDLVFGDIEFVARDKRPLGFTWFSSRCPAGLSEAQYLRRYLEGASVLPFAGCFAKTRVLCSICMDFTTVSVTDMIFWSSILLCGGVLDFVREPVALYRVHELQMCGVANSKVIERRSSFESARFVLHLLRAPWALSRVNEVVDEKYRLLPGEESLVPFVLSRQILTHTQDASIIFSVRLVLADLLGQKDIRFQLQKRFSWGIKQLRSEIQQHPIYHYSYGKDVAKRLSFKTLTYCWVRKLMFIILLRDWRHKRKERAGRTI